MHYTRAFLILVAFSVAKATTNNNQTVYIEIGQNWNEIGPEEIEARENVTSCEIRNNNGTYFIFHPKSLEDLGSEQYGTVKFAPNLFRYCIISVYKMTESDSGEWQVRMNKTTKETKIQTWNVKVYKKRDLFPSSKVKVFPNRDIPIHFKEEYENLAYCRIMSPQKDEFDSTTSKPGAVPSKNCGLHIVAKKEHIGTWTLIAGLKNGTTFLGTIDISLQDEKDLEPTQIILSFHRGGKGVISISNKLKHVKMCILEDPHGFRLPIVSGPCHHTINPVTKYHDGIWKAYYGLEGIHRLIEQRVFVHSYDVIPLNSSISRSDNGDINLLCRARGESINFCSFVHPEGEILHMTSAVSNSKYTYYGDGIPEDERSYESSVYDCGITIHNPKKSDYGSWKCLVRVSSSKTLGKILKVSPPKGCENVEVITTGENVNVKLGNSYTVKCSADEPLSYCWFRSPNGTIHSVFSGKNVKTPELAYNGSGLELGDCSAHVPEATLTDAGKWSCHMGVVDGPEVQSSFDVILRDTYLMAANDEIVFDSRVITNLECHPLTHSDKVIETCRWVNPAGRGIHINRDGRYITETAATHCRLSIRVIDFNEDIGKWSCYARFSGILEEGSAYINVTHYRLPDILNSTLLTILFLCMIISLHLILDIVIKFMTERNEDHKILE
ncbi:hypothetical protein QAD02_010095 [Eretmocerus hayati]|uniref:Uncharacterized protein n=1 Tax=Eretmocerus hayati TaxID=131215 RepID=A0ACC2NB80_9HYME|nr:hypothetical protein QAD02_010095 [Eretmocerus hayati]